MTKLVNRAKMTTATTGTGTITLGSAVDGYQTFADAGVANADVVRYVIEDGDAWEIGLGTYTASGTTLTRGSIESSNADAALNLTGNAVVYVSAAAADLQELVDFADNFVLPTADGSTGQVLQTNGAGTLSFTTISGYTDADVDTHLNTGTASAGEVLSWTGSDYDWVTAGGAFSVVGTRNLAGITTLPDITTGTDNFAAANNAGVNLTTGSSNVAIGNGALDSATTAAENVAIGLNAGGSISTATRAIFIGSYAGSNASNGLGIGYRAARYSSSENNTAIGNEALSDTLLTGGANTAIGFQALRSVESGISNVAIGSGAGANITTGSNNICIAGSASSATASNEITIGYSTITRFRVPGLGIDWTSSSLPSAPDVVKLSSIDLSNVSTAEFSLPSGYDYFTFALGKVLPASDTVYLLARLSSNGGTSYETSYTVNYANFSGTVNNVVFTTSAAYFVGQGVGNAAGEEGISGNIKVMFPALTKDAIIEGHVAYENSDGVFAQTLTSNRVNANSAMNYIKFYFSSGNLSSGTITLYGHKA